MIRGRRRGLPAAFVCIVVASMALLAPAAQPSTAVAGSSVYARTTRSFDGHDLRTRGYLDDLCLQARFMPCLTSESGMYRPEGTAQALAIQRLVVLRNHTFYPLTDASADPVQWEVAGPDDADPPADVDDGGADLPCSDGMRIDILTEGDGALSAYEVADWKGGTISSWSAARTRLDCEIGRARSFGLDVEPGRELLGAAGRWTDSYVDNQGQVWCAWADQKTPGVESSGPGLIFYGRQSDPTLPDDVSKAPGCNQAAEDQLAARCRDQLDKGCSLSSAWSLVALALTFTGVRGDDAPVPWLPLSVGEPLLRPAALLPDSQGIAQFTVRVGQGASPLTVLLDYGDGTYETFSVPADPTDGAVSVIDTAHAYMPGFGVTLARATVIGPGAGEVVESDSIVAEDSDLVLPGELGFTDQGLCFGRTTIAAGFNGSVIVDTTGDVWAWGDALQTIDGVVPEPTRVPGLHDIVSVAGGGAYYLALRSDGSVWMWGSIGGATNSGPGTTYGSLAPVLVGVAPSGPGGRSWGPIVGIAGTGTAAYAITGQSRLWAWGMNVGDGGTDEDLDAGPPDVRPGLPAAATIGNGGSMGHTLVADANGTVYGWGDNVYGQVRVGLPDPVTTPRRVISGTNGTVGGGEWTSSVVLRDGSLWTWPNSGIKGDPHTDGSPEPVPGMPGAVVSVTGTAITGAALVSDGGVYSWGSNYDGELGDGGGTNEMSTWGGQTVFRAKVDGVTQLSGGQAHLLARLSDGSLAAWGANWSGQIGNGDVDFVRGVSAPYRVPEFGPGGSALVASPGACASGAAAAIAAQTAQGSLAAQARVTPAQAAARVKTPRVDPRMRVQPRWHAASGHSGPVAHTVRRASHVRVRVPVVTPFRVPAVRGGPVRTPVHGSEVVVSR